MAGLLDELAEFAPQDGDHVWLPDTNRRPAPSTMVRLAFPDADIHVAASQFGEDAHRLGRLRLDRTLTRTEHAVLVDRAVAWSKHDRSLDEIIAAFGPPSVTFGSPDPDRPKTLGHATADRTAPVVAFHLGHAQAGTEPAANGVPPDGVALLAVRVREDFVRGRRVTPRGGSYFSS